MLLRLKTRGIVPTGFIDVGAHFGETVMEIRSVFPGVRIVSFEANPHCEPMLQQVGADYLIGLLGSKDDPSVDFFLNSNDLTSTGCSVFKETTDHFKSPTVIQLPMYRLDSVIPVEAKLNFLKMDVQGAELMVLDGATKLLPHINWIYLEVSFKECNEGAPLANTVFNYLYERKYRIADVVDPTWVNGELLQCNFLFEKYEN